MSGMDITFPSQQFAAEQHWRGEEMVQRSMEGAQALNQQQAQFGLQQRALEAELKMQAFQMERQMNQQKIKEMLAIDSLEQSRAQTALLNEQAELARLQRNQFEKSLDPEQSRFDRALENEKRRYAEWDERPELGYGAGWIQDPSAAFGWRPPESDEEFDEALKRFQRVKPTGDDYDPAKDPNYRFLQQRYEGMVRSGMANPSQLNAALEEWRQYVQGVGGDPKSLPKEPPKPSRPKYAERARNLVISQAHPAAQFLLSQPAIQPQIDDLLQDVVERAIKIQKKFGKPESEIIQAAVQGFWENTIVTSKLLEDAGLEPEAIHELMRRWYSPK